MGNFKKENHFIKVKWLVSKYQTNRFGINENVLYKENIVYAESVLLISLMDLVKPQI